jgi:hypothetical protein
LAQNEHVQRVNFSGISPSISNVFPPQWQLPEMGITISLWIRNRFAQREPARNRSWLVSQPAGRPLGSRCSRTPDRPEHQNRLGVAAGRETNMRASMAYFAGAGTVIAAIVGGVGGGLLIADMISPKSPKQELTLLERRTPPAPIQAAVGASEPVAYLAAPQPSAPNPPAAAAPTPAMTQADNSASTPAPPVDTAAGSKAAVSPAQPAAPTTQAAAREQTATPQTAAAEEAFAKPRDADVKRTTEKRRFERRQQWTERRRYQPRQDQELRDVEESVRDETGPRREFRVREVTEPRREFAVEPVRNETPLMRLFGSEWKLALTGHGSSASDALVPWPESNIREQRIRPSASHPTAHSLP